MVLSADSTDSPSALYASPSVACAIANSGSISTARRKKGIAAAWPEEDSSSSDAVRFQGFDRTGRGFGQGRMLFNRGRRFAGPGSESTGDLAERVEDVLLPCRLDLLLIEDAARRAVPGAQAQHILAAKTGNRPLQSHRTCGSLADLLRDVRRHPRVFRLAHQRQHLLDLPVRNHGKRRLFELERQPLTERIVKDGIAGLVVEVRQHDGVLLGQRGSGRGIAT